VSALISLLAACACGHEDLERAAAFRGGLTKLRGSGVVHVAGVLRFTPSSAPTELEAYVEMRSTGPRGLIVFRQGELYRALLLSADRGHERDETGTYRAAEGPELDRLRGEILTLLLAARFPADGPWVPSEPGRFRRAGDGAEAVVDGEGQLREVLLPGASPRRRTFEGSFLHKGILYPRRIAAIEGAREEWTLEIRSMRPHALVIDALFEPPRPSGDLGVVLDPASASRPARRYELDKPFLRRDPLRGARVVKLNPPIPLSERAALQEKIGAQAREGGVVRGRLDADGRVAALEVHEPVSSSPVESDLPETWVVAILVGDGTEPSAIADADRKVREVGKARGLELEPFAIVTLPSVSGSLPATQPADRRFELARRLLR
jgi:hypothetical protein